MVRGTVSGKLEIRLLGGLGARLVTGLAITKPTPKKHLQKATLKYFWGGFIEILVKRQINEIIVMIYFIQIDSFIVY